MKVQEAAARAVAAAAAAAGVAAAAVAEAAAAVAAARLHALKTGVHSASNFVVQSMLTTCAKHATNQKSAEWYLVMHFVPKLGHALAMSVP